MSARDPEVAAASVFLAAAAMALVACVLFYADRGFDYSDEGLYLNWIANPAIYDTSFSQFGYIYHPLYEALGGDVAWLRRIAFLITFGLAAGLFKRIAAAAPSGRLETSAVAAALACSTLTLAHPWLPTPNYNSLNLQGLLIVALGFSLVSAPDRRRDESVGAALIGLGGWLCFSAKPTTAVILAPLALIVILGAARNRMKAIAVAGGFASLLLLAALLTLDAGRLGDHVGRYQRALELAQILRPAYSIDMLLSRLEFEWAGADLAVFQAILATAAVYSILAFTEGAATSLMRLLVIGACAIFAVAVASGFLAPRPTAARWAQEMWLVAPAIGVATGALLAQTRARAPPSRRGLFAAALFIMPAAYSFGTSNNFWYNAVDATALWCAAAAAIACGAGEPVHRAASLRLLAGGSVAVSSVLLAIGLAHPYRQATPIPAQREATAIADRGRTLKLDLPNREYIETLRTGAATNGFVAGTPVLDMTGRHPGTVFALAGTAPGSGWLISGYPGSKEFASRALDRVECATLGRSWLLRSPGGLYTLPDEVVVIQGLDPVAGYVVAARAEAPTGLGAHVLLKPKSPEAAAKSCERRRQANSAR